MANSDIYHADFKAMPYWWEAYHPTAQDPIDLPPHVRVAIVGGGYGGLSTALEAAKQLDGMKFCLNKPEEEPGVEEEQEPAEVDSDVEDEKDVEEDAYVEH